MGDCLFETVGCAMVTAMKVLLVAVLWAILGAAIALVVMGLTHTRADDDSSRDVIATAGVPEGRWVTRISYGMDGSFTYEVFCFRGPCSDTEPAYRCRDVFDGTVCTEVDDDDNAIDTPPSDDAETFEQPYTIDL